MKVGDKIRAIKTDSMFFRNGDEGVIVIHADDDEEGDYWAVFNGNGFYCCIGPMTPTDEWQFEVIDEKACTHPETVVDTACEGCIV